MSIKLLKQNSTLILYIVNFIELLKSEKAKVMNSKNICCADKMILIRHYNELVEYFEQCLKEVNKC